MTLIKIYKYLFISKNTHTFRDDEKEKIHSLNDLN